MEPSQAVCFPAALNAGLIGSGLVLLHALLTSMHACHVYDSIQMPFPLHSRLSV